MKYIGKNKELLLEDFRKYLRTNLEIVGLNKLIEVWPDELWTDFYKGDLFVRISENLNLQYRLKEYLTIDALFYSKSQKDAYEVPMVVIETENEIGTIGDSELYKLCCINAPLKVIFTWCNEWNEATKKELLDEDWFYILKEFERAEQINGNLLFVVAEKTVTNFNFHSFVYDKIINDKIIIKDERKFEISK